MFGACKKLMFNKKNNLYEIVPAILPKSFSELREKILLVAGKVSIVQIDICDGKFVPSQTWPFGSLNLAEEIEELREILKETKIEIDAMVEEPFEIYTIIKQLPIKRFFLHFEAINKEKFEAFSEIAKNGGVTVGLAISLDSPVENLRPYIFGETPLIQVMGISRIGFQGELLDERVFPRLRALRSLYPRAIISVDGGVSQKEAGELLQSGANFLVAGSAIFSADDIGKALDYFNNLSLE